MYILLALLAQVAADWVEISQQHYMKPFQSTVSEIYVEGTTRGSMVYHNVSLSHSWKKGSVNKSPKLGSVQRIHPTIHAVKAPSMQGMLTHSLHNNHEGIDDYESDQMDFKNIFQPASESILDISDEIGGKTKQFYTQRPITKHSFVTKNFGYTEITTEAIRSKYILQTNRHKPSTEKAQIFKKNSNEATNEQVSSEYTTNRAIEIFTNLRHHDHKTHNKHSQVKHAPTRDQNVYSEKNKVPAIDQIINPNNRYQEFHEEHLDSSSVANEEADVTIEEEKHGPVNSNNFESSQNHSVENMLKFLKVISQTIKRNTHGSVTSKTKYLQNLKDSILANIEERIESLWPERRSRRRRAARGHLEIPSSESALMSISFLTFAVFLIKLVLQLIQTYKNKTMMVAPTVVAAVGRAAAAASSSPKP
ncbi:hypothetical protein ACJJTC_005295 [Scirpophaga incertulas]